MSWRCPKCGSVNLHVTVTTTAKLIQDGNGWTTEIVGDHEWGEFDFMECKDCDFGESTHVFKEKES